jgi:hypothetical protein
MITRSKTRNASGCVRCGRKECKCVAGDRCSTCGTLASDNGSCYACTATESDCDSVSDDEFTYDVPKYTASDFESDTEEFELPEDEGRCKDCQDSGQYEIDISVPGPLHYVKRKIACPTCLPCPLEEEYGPGDLAYGRQKRIRARIRWIYGCIPKPECKSCRGVKSPDMFCTDCGSKSDLKEWEESFNRRSGVYGYIAVALILFIFIMSIVH